jgi:hypothetical protein
MSVERAQRRREANTARRAFQYEASGFRSVILRAPWDEARGRHIMLRRKATVMGAA